MSEVEPPRAMPSAAPPHEVLRVALGALERGERVVIATVIARHGSAPSTPGQKLLLSPTAGALGTVGGGAVEKAVLDAMSRALSGPPPAPRVETFRLGAALGMCCGGSVEILIEPLVPPMHALLVGAGHVGVYLAPLLASLGFQVTLVDARAEAADASRLPAAFPSSSTAAEGAALPTSVRVVHADHDDPEVLRGFASERAGAAFLVMTHDHQLDQAAIEWAIGRGFGFVGGVGSRAKAARTRARLEAKGFGAADVARVRMPIGVDVGARSPAEIGVAIAAELIAWRAELERVSRRGTAALRAAGAGAPAALLGGDPAPGAEEAADR